MPDGSTSTQSRPRCDCSAPTNESPIPTVASRSSPKPAMPFAQQHCSPRRTSRHSSGWSTASRSATFRSLNVGVPAVLVSALVLGSRCERQIRARRTFDTAGHPWVLSDVATEPHLGIGNQLLAEDVSRADDANADVVLTVGEENGIARERCAGHHFLVIDGRGQAIAMRRRVRARLSGSDPSQAGVDL